MWRPTCSLETMKARSALYAQIRAFFVARGVSEVETPIMSRAGASDPWLASFQVQDIQPWYLQTSPEFPMKRLLAAGSGSIFQICKCFRREEVSARHNSEFTMLEWYRPESSFDALLDEISELVASVLNCQKATTITYKNAFQQYLHIHPFAVSDEVLEQAVLEHTSYRGERLDRISSLDLLLSMHIEPKLGWDRPCFLTDYPAEQASLAKVGVDEEGFRVAKRAELYVNGLELANAYDELTNAAEQEARFREDNANRRTMGLPEIATDHHLLAAMTEGLPECVGVALGVDRLLMLKIGAVHVEEVLTFPAPRA